MYGWQEAPFFGLKWGEYRRESEDMKMLSPRLLELLDHLDEFVGGRLVVNRTYTESTQHGFHPRGMAFDGRIEGMDLLDQFINITRFPWGGIGLYGEDVWNTAGFHVDVRERRPQSRWACVRGEGGERRYVALTRHQFRGLDK